jgi:large subunit ribosomal protein L2
MVKRLKLQRRGKGSPKYKATIHAKCKVKYRLYNGVQKAQVVNMLTDPIRSAPLAEILFDDGKKDYVIASEGIVTGQKLEFGNGASQAVGNVLSLSDIENGTEIFNIERNYGDGGKFVRAGGSSAVIVSKKENQAIVKMPSGELKLFPLNVRATVGFIASSGRKTKPFVKAGNKYHAMKAKGKPYPTVRGVAMNAVDHPFGGGQHHVGHSKSTSRHDSAGRKVGSIASKRTGRKKKN